MLLFPLDAILEHCRTVHELVKTMKCGLCQFTSNLRQEMEDHFTSRHKACTPAILRAYQVKVRAVPFHLQPVLLIRIRMDRHNFGKLDPDPDTHQNGKPDPHQSEKVQAIEGHGHFGALDGPNLEKSEWYYPDPDQIDR
jgi:hypothetical protein